MSAKKKGKREYVNDSETRDFTVKLNDYFETNVEIPRMRVGKRPILETLVSEEALLFAKYLRKEEKEGVLRIEIKK